MVMPLSIGLEFIWLCLGQTATGTMRSATSVFPMKQKLGSYSGRLLNVKIGCAEKSDRLLTEAKPLDRFSLSLLQPAAFELLGALS
ncbi:MAG TPA: hypothetical protein DDZ34_08505 [Syntrophaceae bacterium]|nr:hypothetical protein [Syntrophaceae bacterium]